MNSPKNGESGGEKPGKHEKAEKEKKKKEPKPSGHVSNKQKKFSRHFTQVNLDDKVINCKYNFYWLTGS